MLRMLDLISLARLALMVKGKVFGSEAMMQSFNFGESHPRIFLVTFFVLL